jgi:PAS domain S-box-containing protein
MKKIHSLLRRQLKRFFDDAGNVPPELDDFISTINSAYFEFDMERGMLERSLDLSSHEMLQINAEMRAVFHALPDMFFVIDEKGTILDHKTGTMADMYHTEEKKLIGKSIQSIPIPEVGQKFRDALEKILRDRSVISIEYNLPINGVKNYYEARLAPVMENRYIVIVRNITERIIAEEGKKHLESQLRQAQKMEAIGTLAGGVAHDFNNLLMGIQGRTSLMLIDSQPSHPYYEHLLGIEEYVKSATGLTKQLLGFAMGGKYEVRPRNLNEIIKKSSDMFGRTRKEVVIKTHFQNECWTVEVDQGQIEQVLLNLFLNASQAMPGGGDLFIRTENVILDEEYVLPYGMKPGRYVKISVTDTGMGMDKNTQERIFDPFFTTKGVGRGTGLGLPSAYGIIKNHDGIINVYSEKGKGSTFTIYLPASVKARSKETTPRENLTKGNENILLVDDEEMILDIGKKMIEALGYKVVTAHSGKQAVSLYKQHPEGFDLVVLDMIMPEISGSETFILLKEINPLVKVLLSSGYSIDGQAKEILNRGCKAFIQKPFNMKELSQKLRSILDYGENPSQD